MEGSIANPTGAGKSVLDAAKDGQAEKLRTFLKEGRPIEYQDDLGWTPLHHAAHGGHKECLEALIEQSKKL